MKLRENISYEIINWISTLLGLRKIFVNKKYWIFSKNYILKKRENINVFWKEIKWKVAKRMFYSQAEIDISPKITLQPEFLLWSPFSLVLLMDFLKILVIIGFSTMKYGQNNKIIKGKIYATSFSSKFHSRMFISLKFISTGCYPSKFDGKYFNFVWF